MNIYNSAVSARKPEIQAVDSVRYTVEDDLAIITLDHPPVNALSVNDGMVQRLGDLFEQGECDPGVRAFVLIGAGPNFCGGAEIKEFGQAYDRTLIDVPLLCPLMDRLDKPIVAAVHGAVMGGGLELALACHYRIASRDARLALPEVKLGVLPGAGGIQRIARILGAERALDFVVSGDSITADQALEMGLVEAIAEGDLAAAAKAYARRRLAEGAGRRRVRDGEVTLVGDSRAFLAAARQRIAATWPGYPAPLAAVDCIEAALQKPFDESVALDSQIFDQLVMTPEAAALRYIFFAQRAAARIDDIGSEIAGHQIVAVGLVDGGETAANLAMVFSFAGIGVTVFDHDNTVLSETQALFVKRLDSAVAKGRLSAEKVRQSLALFHTTSSYEGLNGCSLVLESASKDEAASARLFSELDAACRPDVVFAANGPSVRIGKLAAVTSRPQSVIGLHFFTPAHVMRLVELVRTPQTSPGKLASAMKFCRRIDKVPVVSADIKGLIGNNMLYRYFREAKFILEEGASVSEVDAAMRGFGMPMGPFQTEDLIGLDVVPALSAENGSRTSRIGALLCERERLGQKSGAGYYDYGEGVRTGRPSMVVDEIIERERNRLGLVRRQIADDEIVSRLVFRLVIEGARLLEARTAQRAGDIDLVYVFGYGFPAYRGGPMFHADRHGLDRVLAQVKVLCAAHGEVWAPPHLLVELASKGGRFTG